MSEHTVEGPAVKRLERSRSDRMLAGVSGGLASYFEIHPAFFRVGFVVLTLLGGSGIVIYLAAALVMPDEGKEDSVVSAALRNRRDDRPRRLQTGSQRGELGQRDVGAFQLAGRGQHMGCDLGELVVGDVDNRENVERL